MVTTATDFRVKKPVPNKAWAAFGLLLIVSGANLYVAFVVVQSVYQFLRESGQPSGPIILRWRLFFDLLACAWPVLGIAFMTRTSGKKVIWPIFALSVIPVIQAAVTLSILVSLVVGQI
jgi:uncharacterized membrane protein